MKCEFFGEILAKWKIQYNVEREFVINALRQQIFIKYLVCAGHYHQCAKENLYALKEFIFQWGGSEGTDDK